MRAQALFVIRQAFAAAGSTVLSVWLARVASSAVLGFNAEFQFVLLLIQLLSGCGFQSYLVYRDAEPETGDISAQFAANVIVGGAVSLLAVLAIGYWGDGLFGLSYRGLANAIALFVAVGANAYQINRIVILERNVKFGTIYTIEMVQVFVQVAGGLSLVLAGFHDVALTVSVALRALTGAWLSGVLVTTPRMRAAWNTGALMRAGRYALPLQLGQLVNLVKDALNPLVVATLHGSAAVGTISAVQLIANCPAMLMYPVQRLLFSRYSRANRAGGSPDIAREMLAITLVLAIGVALIRQHFALLDEWIFAGRWVNYCSEARLLSLTALAVPWIIILSARLSSLGETKSVLLFNCASALCALAVGVPAVRVWGISGYIVGWYAMHAPVTVLVYLGRRHIVLRVYCAYLIGILPIVVYPYLVGGLCWLSAQGIVMRVVGVGSMAALAIFGAFFICFYRRDHRSGGPK